MFWDISWRTMGADEGADEDPAGCSDCDGGIGGADEGADDDPAGCSGCEGGIGG